jgi:hypothetical protein
MKLKSFLITTVIAATAFTGTQAFAKSKHIITTGTAYQEASNLIAFTSRARYALANNDPVLARSYIEAAKIAGKNLAKSALDKNKVKDIQSGRVSYESTLKDGAYYYYPVEAARVTQKDLNYGPFWKDNKGLAVKDAEFIYVTVNISGVDVQKDLDKASQEIDGKQYEDASDELQDLIEDVVTVEERKEAYALKARDNLLLARNYFDAGNYDLARYPFKHAKSALEHMKGNKDYADQQELVLKYLEEINRSEKVIAENDPNALEKLKTELKADWEGMKDWVDKKID